MKQLHSHTPTMISTSVLIIIYMLLSATRIEAQFVYDNDLIIIGSDVIPTAPINRNVFIFNAKNLTGAFRAGHITSDNWSIPNLGFASIAAGINTKASSSYAAAFGDNTSASGEASFAFGQSTDASGQYSVAGGNGTTASGYASMAIGDGATSTDSAAVALGANTTSSGKYSFAYGANASATGDYSISMGHTTNASANNATALGVGTQANKEYMVTVGAFNATIPNPQNGQTRFVVGSGVQGSVQNALVVNNSASVGIGINDPGLGISLDVNGNIVHSGSMFCTSDQRLKKNITPLASTLSLINNINAYSYKWKQKSTVRTYHNEREIGVIAQEIEKIFPQMVSLDSGGYRVINYNQLIPVLMKALQELNTETNDIEHEIKTLSGHILGSLSHNMKTKK